MIELVLAGLLSLALLAVALQTVGRVRRLHRLHRRTDAAAAGLDAALRRRARAALRVARSDSAPTTGAPSHSERLAAARAVLVAPPLPVAGSADREEGENRLGRALARLDRGLLPPDVVAELTAAERQVVLARRVFHDAVRDTRALRARAVVRWLRLAGTAPYPAYLEIAEPAEELDRGPVRADVPSSRPT